MQNVGDAGDRVRDRLLTPIQIQLRTRQPTCDSIAVIAQLEVEFHTDRCLGVGARESNGVAPSPRGLVAIQSPRDCLEYRRLACAVRTDDAGDSGSEFDRGTARAAGSW